LEHDTLAVDAAATDSVVTHAAVSAPAAGAAVLASAPLPEQPTTSAGHVVYDKRDTDVTPPTELWPRFPEPSATIPGGDVAVFDLVVDEAGHVESARARLPLRRWDHVMLLSALKASRFQPATREGHPVRYRKEVLVRVSR
jgi:hypothetical protein